MIEVSATSQKLRYYSSGLPKFHHEMCILGSHGQNFFACFHTNFSPPSRKKKFLYATLLSLTYSYTLAQTYINTVCTLYTVLFPLSHKASSHTHTHTLTLTLTLTLTDTHTHSHSHSHSHTHSHTHTHSAHIQVRATDAVAHCCMYIATLSLTPLKQLSPLRNDTRNCSSGGSPLATCFSKFSWGSKSSSTPDSRLSPCLVPFELLG